MAEFRLNKPLYKEDSPGTPPPPGEDSGAGAATAPRPARPMLLARIGAVIADILLLHLVLYALVRYGHDWTIRLGDGGRWLGLVIGFLYFSVGASSIAGGRTAGKFLLRLRVSETAGPDLPYAVAAKRTALLMWPVAAFILLGQIADSLLRPDEITITPMLGLGGLALMLGWFAGNAAYAGADAHGRTWVDRAVGSVVVASDAPYEGLQAFLRDVRETRDPQRDSRAKRFLWGIMIGALAITGFFAWQQQQRIDKLTAQEKAQYLGYQQAVHVEGFGQPIIQAPSREIASEDTQTSGLWFQYARRAPIDVEALKQDAQAMTVVDRIIVQYRRLAQDVRLKNPDAVIPERMRFYVSFAEQSDLLFASYARNVHTLSKVADMRAPTAADDQATTPPAAAAPPAAADDQATTPPLGATGQETTPTAPAAAAQQETTPPLGAAEPGV